MATISTKILVKFIMNKIMKRYFHFIVVLFFPLVTHGEISNAEQTNLQVSPFTQTVFEKLKGQYQGKKWLTLLWSVDCPPCMKELALVQKLQQQKPGLAIVIVNVDTHENSEQQRDEILLHFDLTQHKHLYFRDGLEDQSRYYIDPQWFGELPRSYFIDEAGFFHGKSGLVSKTLLEQWLLTANH